MAFRSSRSPAAPPRSLARVPGLPTPGHDAAPYMPSWLQAADHHTLPVSPRRLRATCSYLTDPWYRVPKALAILLGRKARGCWYECGYVIEGANVVVDKVYSFGAALHYEQGVALALGTNHAYRAKERHINARRSRGILIIAALGAVAVLAIWLKFHHPYAGLAISIGLATALDAIGRRGRAPKPKPHRKPAPLRSGTPCTIVWGQISEFLRSQKTDLSSAIQVYDVRVDPWRDAYLVDVHTEMEIKADLLRALEMRIRVPNNCRIRLVHGQHAADKTLIIPLSNPLEHITELPWIPAGALSAWNPLPLGESVDPQTPYELILAGQHMSIVGLPGAGKTTVHINNAIDRLSACRDAVQWAATLDKPDNFKAWGTVLSRTAYTVMDIDALLDDAITEMERRSRVLDELTARARQLGDPSIRRKEWTPDLGPALFIWLDEFPQIAPWNGTKRDAHGNAPNLLFKVERLLRVGRAMAVSVGLGVQKTGNQDSGSSVVVGLTTLKIVGPCDERDTVAVFGVDKRDAGYAPHLLEPAKLGGPHCDAGMAVIDGARFGPDYVRGGAPFDVLARSMRREAEWADKGNRPMLPIEVVIPAVPFINAEALPPALGALVMAFDHYQADILSSDIIVTYANLQGDNWTQDSLAEALKRESPQVSVTTKNGRCRVRRKTLRSYYKRDVDQALQALEDTP